MNTEKDMKHIFYCHSYITLICALAHIKYKPIDHKKCLVIFDRGFYPKSSELVDLQKIHFIDQNRKQKKEFIDTIIRTESFLIYIPHLHIREVNQMVSHKNCIGYYFLEEGAASLIEPQNFKKKSFFQLFKQLLNKKQRFKKQHYLYSDKKLHKGQISFTKSAFGSAFNTINYPNALASLDLPRPKKQVTILFVLDPLPYINKANLFLYYETLFSIITRIKDNNHDETIYIKHHPTETLDFSTLPQSKEFEYLQTLDPSVCLEKIIYEDSPTIHYFFSSLEYLTQEIGGNCISHSEELASRDQKFASFLAEE